MAVIPINRPLPLALTSRTSPTFISVAPAVEGSELEGDPQFRPTCYIHTATGAGDFHTARGAESFGSAEMTLDRIAQRLEEYYRWQGYTTAALGTVGNFALPIFLNSWGQSWAEERRIFGNPRDSLGTVGENPWADLSPSCAHAVAEMGPQSAGLGYQVKTRCAAGGLRTPQLGFLDAEMQYVLLLGAAGGTWDTSYTPFPGQAAVAPTYALTHYEGWIAAALALPESDPRRTSTCYRRLENGLWANHCLNDWFAENLAGYTGSTTTDNLTLGWQYLRNALVLAILRLTAENMSYRAWAGVYAPWRTEIPGTKWANYDIRASPVSNPAHEFFFHVPVPAINEDYSSLTVYPPGAGHVYPDTFIQGDVTQIRGHWYAGQLIPASGGNRPIIAWHWAAETKNFGGESANGYDTTVDDINFLIAKAHGLGATIHMQWREDNRAGHLECSDTDTLPSVQFMRNYARSRGTRVI